MGRLGEEEAQRFLLAGGFRILARNWRPERQPTPDRRGLELDLVAERSGTLIFVEVKSRRKVADFAQRLRPVANFTPAKRKKFLDAARLFLSEQEKWGQPCRFDLVCVEFSPRGAELEHFVDVIEERQALGCGHSAWQPW